MYISNALNTWIQAFDVFIHFLYHNQEVSVEEVYDLSFIKSGTQVYILHAAFNFIEIHSYKSQSENGNLSRWKRILCLDTISI